MDQGRRVALLGVMALGACVDERFLPPPFQEGGSVAYLYSDPSGARWLEGDGPGGALRFDLAEGSSLWALRYGTDLASLQLGPERAAVLSSAPGRRPIPRPEALLTADLSQPALSWTPLAFEALSGLALSAFDPSQCLAQRQCVTGTPSCAPCPEAAAPVAPRPPVLPCPAAWVLDPAPREDGLLVCRPQAPPRLDCPSAERQRPGSAVCEPFAPCPSGPWPAEPPGRASRYVRAGEVGGDGSLERPFGSITAALAAAPTPRTLLIGRGQYSEALRLDRADDLLVGACPSETEITASGATALVVTASVTVEGLGFSGQAPMQVAAGGALHLARSIVGAGSGTGLSVQGQLWAQDVRVQDRVGVGIIAHPGARVELGDSELRGSTGAQLYCSGAEVEGAQVRVVGGGAGDRCQSAGIIADQGCQLDWRGSTIEGVCRAGLETRDPGTLARISDSVVRDSAVAGADDGRGFAVFGGSKVELERVAILGTHKGGIHVIDARVSAEDVLISRVEPTDGDSFGLYVGDKAVLSGRRLFLELNRGHSVGLVNTSSVSLVDTGIDSGDDASHIWISGAWLYVHRLRRVGPGGLYLAGIFDQQISDVEVDQGDLEVSYFPEVEVARLAVRGGRKVGLHISPRSCGIRCDAMVLRDVSVVLPSPKLGIDVETVLPFRLERFFVEGAATGLRLREGEVDLVDGLVRGAQIGLTAPSLPAEPNRIFGALRFEDTPQSFGIEATD